MNNINSASSAWIVKKLAEHGRLALQAAQATADTDVRAHVDHMRQLRAVLKRKSAQGTAEDTNTARPLPFYEELAEAQKDIARAEKFIGVWSQRYLQLFSRTDLLKTVDGCHALLDAELSATWDWDNDLLICAVDHQDHPLLQTLEERQQQRVLVVHESTAAWTRPLPPQWRSFQVGSALANDAWFSPPIGHICVFNTLMTPDSPKLLEEVRMEVMSHLSRAATFRLFGHRWLEQGLENLVTIAQHPAWSNLKILTKDLPAVIVSPGPSLQQNLHLLKGMQDRILIIATAQAIMALQAEGIAPHVIVVADPQDMSHYFDGYTFPEQTVLAVGRTCSPALFKLPAQHFTTLSVSPLSDGWIKHILHDEDFLHAGGSVAITAFSMALNWSCRSIALIGQDLALKDGQQYAPNTADAGLAWQLPQQGDTVTPTHIPDGIRGMHHRSGRPEDIDKAVQLLQLPGYHGGKVWTKTDYYLYHSHFERIAQEVQQSTSPQPSLYNCTEGGAHIAGFEQCSLQTWMDQHAQQQAAFQWTSGLREIERQHAENGATHAKVHQWKHQTLQAMAECMQAANASAELLNRTMTDAKLQQLKANEKVLLDNLEKLEFISIAHQQAIFDALTAIGLAHDLPSALQAEGELIAIIQDAITHFSPFVEQIQA